MKLTQFSDYALRLLVHLARNAPGEKTTITTAAKALGLAVNHLTKIANRLANAKILTTSRGRYGGLTLSRPPDQICVGEVIRLTETDFGLVGCMTAAGCPIASDCQLAPVFNNALGAFLTVMDKSTIADISRRSVPVAVEANERCVDVA